MWMRYNLNNNMVLPPTTYQLPPTQRGQAPLEIGNLRFLPRLVRGSLTGQAVLSTIFIIGGIIVTIALSLAFLATSFVNSAYGFRVSEKAAEVASSGASDALVRLLRDNKCCSPSTYPVVVGSDTATVTVAQDSPAVGKITITSSATISFHQRTETIVVSKNSTSGLITIISDIKS